MTALEATAALAVLLAQAAMTLAVVGLFRLPDTLTRLHAASKILSVGIAALLVASVGTADLALMGRALLVAAFLVLSSPLTSHAIARAAHRRR